MEERELTGIKVWKILFILSLLFLIISLICFFCSRPKNMKKKIINNNYEVQTIKGIIFDKIKIYKRNSKYYFTARAKNKTKKDISINRIIVKLDDYSFNAFIGKSLNNNEYKMIFMETKEDIGNVNKVSFIFD